MVNACVVSEGTLWRGGKPDAQGAANLVELGVRNVVNLELLHSDIAAFREARPPITHERAIGYFKVQEWEPNVIVAPSKLDEHIAEFLAITRTQAKPIYVHCRSGQNRTGIMVAAYRVFEEGVPVEQAIDEMRRYQGVWFSPNASYLRELVSERRERLLALVEQKALAIHSDAQLICDNSGCRKAHAKDNQ